MRVFINCLFINLLLLTSCDVLNSDNQKNYPVGTVSEIVRKSDGVLISAPFSGLNLALSHDSGLNWKREKISDDDIRIRSIDTYKNNLVLLGINLWDNKISVLFSSNNGSDWKNITKNLPESGINMPRIKFTSDRYIVLSLDWEWYRFDIKNEVWDKITPASTPFSHPFIDLTNDKIYALSDSLYKSSDEGDSWQGVSELLYESHESYMTYGILINDHIIGHSFDSKLYRIDTETGGLEMVNNQLRSDKYAKVFGADSDGNILVSDGSELFFSNDLGDSWKSLGKPGSGEDYRITSMVGLDRRYIVGTYAKGIYYIDKNETMWEKAYINQ